VNAVIYCRVSSDMQEENWSLETQEAACRRFAAERGYAVIAAHQEVHSGFDLWERPQLARVREMVRDGRVQAVIAYALDRLSRNQTHIAILDDECERAGVALLFATEEFEKTPEGKLIRSVKAFAAELEREKIKERTQRGRRARAESGQLIPGRRALYGYRYRDEARSAYDVDPETAAIVRGIFAASARGTSTRAIATDLERRGIPSPGGSPRWYHTTINKILSNPAYAGRAVGFRVHVTKLPGGKTVRAERPADQQIALPAGTVPPLVDEATFAAVQSRLARNKIEATRNNRNPEGSLLRGGYVKCGICGHVVRVHNRDDGARTPSMYRCEPLRGREACGKPIITMKSLDRAVWERVEAVLLNPEIVRQQLERLQGEDGLADDVASVERAIAEVERKRANLARSLTLFDRQEDAEPVVAELAQLAKRRARLDEERVALRTRQEQRAEVYATLEGIEGWCRIVGANLAHLTYAERRLALEALGVSVRIFPRGQSPRYIIEMDPAIVDTTIDSGPKRRWPGR
jgi:site-specific DNA recombinase